MRYIIVLLLLTIPVAAYAVDGTVGSVYREKFIYNTTGTAETAATLSNFTTTWQKDGAIVTTEAATFRNFSSGAYSMNWTPTTTGWYTGTIYYNGTTVVAEWSTNVFASNIDDVSGAALSNYTSKLGKMPSVWPF